jgi:hypothetical protein
MSQHIEMTARRPIGFAVPGRLAWGRVDLWIQGIALVLTAGLVARMSRKLPGEALTTGDSYAYQ